MANEFTEDHIDPRELDLMNQAYFIAVSNTKKAKKKLAQSNYNLILSRMKVLVGEDLARAERTLANLYEFGL